MNLFIVLLSIAADATIVASNVTNPSTKTRRLPPSLRMIGAATSAFQVEGAWNVDGKSPSVLDDFFHDPSARATADDSARSYYLYEEDVRALRALGATHYRFSMSWPRLLPNGTTDVVNRRGVEYYTRLLDALDANGIEPHVTMFHFDLPSSLYVADGVLSDEFPRMFADYARFLFATFGDRVLWWTTFNQPMSVCTFARRVTPAGGYRCALRILRAHANAYRIYEREFRAKQKGKISIAIRCDWFEAADDDELNIDAAETKRQFRVGIVAHPIYSDDGNFPAIVRDWATAENERMAIEGEWGRGGRDADERDLLPAMTGEDVEWIKGTADYFAFNHYATHLTRAMPSRSSSVAETFGVVDVGTISETNRTARGSPLLAWNTIEPEGIGKVLVWLKQQYGDWAFFVTENGYADANPSEDDERIYFHEKYLANLVDTIDRHDVNVIGYTIWSLIDNFEFLAGYNATFGLFRVDMTDPERRRSPKKSVAAIADIIRTRELTV